MEKITNLYLLKDLININQEKAKPKMCRKVHIFMKIGLKEAKIK